MTQDDIAVRTLAEPLDVCVAARRPVDSGHRQIAHAGMPGIGGRELRVMLCNPMRFSPGAVLACTLDRPVGGRLIHDISGAIPIFLDIHFEIISPECVVLRRAAM